MAADIQLERQALGTAATSVEQWEIACLTEEDFSSPHRARVCSAILALRAKGHPASRQNVQLEIERKDAPTDKEFWREFNQCMAPPAEPLSEVQGERLRELSICRGLKARSKAFYMAVDSGSLEDAQAGLETLVKLSSHRDAAQAQSVHEMGLELYETLRGGGVPGIDPGVPILRDHVGNLLAGSLTVVGAPTNVGKTSFAYTMAEGSLTKGGRPGIVSVEDPKEIMAARAVALKADMSPRNMIRGKLSAEDLVRVAKGIERLKDVPFHIAMAMGGTHIAVVQAMRQLVRRGCNVIFVDYLQAIRYRPGPRELMPPKAERVGEITAILKQEAKRLGVPLVLFSQLRRPDKLMLKEPGKHDLKESGDIENAAEIVILLWREKESDDAPVYGRLAKGKLGGVGMKFELYRSEKNGMLYPQSQQPSQSLHLPTNRTTSTSFMNKFAWSNADEEEDF